MGCGSSREATIPSGILTPISNKPVINNSKIEDPKVLLIDKVISFSHTLCLFKVTKLASAYSRLVKYNNDKNIKEIFLKRVENISNFNKVNSRLLPCRLINPTDEKIDCSCLITNDPGMSLIENIITRKIIITESYLRNNLIRIFSTLNDMHNANLYHGKISLDKILIKDNEWYIFDPATGIEKLNDLISENQFYLSPEVLNGNSLDSKADVWAMGVLIYYLICGRHILPICSVSDYSKAIATNDISFNDPIWYQISEPLLDLTRRMLEKDHFKRITMREVMNHNWVEGTKSIASSQEISYTDFFYTELEFQINALKIVKLLATSLNVDELKDLIYKIKKECETAPGATKAADLLYHAQIPPENFRADLSVNFVEVISNAIVLKDLVMDQEKMDELFSC